jgi:hypothetical protein
MTELKTMSFSLGSVCENTKTLPAIRLLYSIGSPLKVSPTQSGGRRSSDAEARTRYSPLEITMILP